MTQRLGLPSAIWVLGLAAGGVAVGAIAAVDPVLAIGTTLAALLLVAILANLTAGLCLLLLVEFLLPGEGGAITVAKGVGFILALSWVALVATRSAEKGGESGFVGDHPLLAYVMSLFLGWAAISSVWALEPANAWDTAFRYGLNLILLLIVYTALRSRRDVVWVYVAFVIGASLAALVGGASAEEANRLSGTYGEPNELASYLVAGLVLALTLTAVKRDSPLLRAVMLAAAGICTVGVMLTLSRAALVALAAAAVTAVVVGGRWRASLVVLALVALTATAVYFAALAPPAARERVTTLESGSGRTGLWTIGWRMVAAHPLEGVGAGNFREASADYLVRPGVIDEDEYIISRPLQAHNVYLGTLAELGLVGGAFFFLIIGACLRCMLMAIARFRAMDDRDSELLARGAFVAVTAVLVTQFFQSEQFSKQLWLLLALGPALLAIARHSVQVAPPYSDPGRHATVEAAPAS